MNLAKSTFGCATVTYLGYVVGQSKVKPVDAKVAAINEFPVPSTKQQLTRFLGLAGYYRTFCPNFSQITESLTALLSKNVSFVWTNKCQAAFDHLKAVLMSAAVIPAPCFYHPFNFSGWCKWCCHWWCSVTRGFWWCWPPRLLAVKEAQQTSKELFHYRKRMFRFGIGPATFWSVCVFFHWTFGVSPYWRIKTKGYWGGVLWCRNTTWSFYQDILYAVV